MSDSPHTTPDEGDASLAYVLFLNPPPIASAEERSMWDMSRWSSRPYRRPYPSTRWTVDDGMSSDSDASPKSIPSDRLSSWSTTDSESQDSDTTYPLTPTFENLVLDDLEGQHAKPEDNKESDQDWMFRRVGRRLNTAERFTSGRYPVVHQLSRAVLGRPSNLRGMGYLALMRISAEDFDWDSPDVDLKSVLVELLADTCSDIAWSLGENPCKIAYYDERRPEVKPKDFRPVDPDEARHHRTLLVEWKKGDTNVFVPHTMLPHDLSFRTSADWRDFQPEFKMSYADDCEAYMIGRERTITVNAYDSDSKSDSVRDVTLNMRWAIAYAVNLTAWDSKSDGVLALSLYEHQGLGGSFLYQLQEILPPRINDFLIMYFTVRPHPSYFPGKRVQSWVAFNRWPTVDKPTFSKNIPIHRNAYRSYFWSVTLLRIEFLEYNGDTRNDRVMYREEYRHGLELLVDSGSSTSELPYRTVNAIHTSVFGNTNPLSSDDRRPTYDIPDRFHPTERYRVRLLFKGEPGEEDVAVFAPFKHFVCARNLKVCPNRIEDCPWQGLIFAAHRDTPFGVLGLNFFQTMHISFHKGREGIHHLRMSTQRRDVEMYRVRSPPDPED